MEKILQELVKIPKDLFSSFRSKRGSGKKYLSFKVRPDSLSMEYVDEPVVYLSRSSCQLLRVNNNTIVTISFKNLRIPARARVASDHIIKPRHCQLNLLSVQALDIRPGNVVNITPPESLVLLIDTSRSMLGLLEDKQQKLRAAKEATETLIHNKIILNENDFIGIVTFGEDRVVFNLTADLESPLYKLYKIKAGGKTYMYGGIESSMDVLRNGIGLKRIIMVTDGVPSSTGKEEVLELIEKKAAGDIIIDTVGVGNRGLSCDNIYSLNAYDEEFLKNISSLTGGEFTFVYNVKRFKHEFEKLAKAKRLFLPKKYMELTYAPPD